MDKTSATSQKLLAAEGLAVLVGLALIILGAALYPLAPVGIGAETGAARAPWIFLGMQELLRRLNPILAGLVLPGLAIAFLFLLPWLAGGRQGAALPGIKRNWAPAEFGAWFILLAWAGLTGLSLFP